MEDGRFEDGQLGGYQVKDLLAGNRPVCSHPGSCPVGSLPVGSFLEGGSEVEGGPERVADGVEGVADGVEGVVEAGSAGVEDGSVGAEDGSAGVGRDSGKSGYPEDNRSCPGGSPPLVDLLGRFSGDIRSGPEGYYYYPWGTQKA